MDASRISLALLSEKKQLPIAFLQRLGWRDADGGVVEIPFFDTDHAPLAVKRRTHLEARKGSFWEKGKRLRAYGLNHLSGDAAWTQRLALVEGESDFATLFFHGIRSLGLPGSNSAKALEKEHLAGCERIDIVREPDQGGDAFVPAVLQQLADLGFEGEVYELRMPAGCKDVNDLHCRDPKAFPKQWRNLQAAATRLRLPTPTPPLPDAGRGQGRGCACPTDQEAEVPDVLDLSTVEEEPVFWLWPGWVPLEMLSLIEGDPGTGKSSLLLDLAARRTRGAAPPFSKEARPAENVLVLASEDHVAKVVKPRLVRLGADMKRIRFFRGFRRGGRHRLLYLPGDIPALQKEIEDHDVGLVVFDPLSAFLDRTLSINSDQDMRAVFHELAELAQQTHTALIVLRHLNKVQGASALQRGSGSMAIIASVRSAMLAARDPRSEERTFLLLLNKANLAGPTPALRYRIVADRGVAKIEWLEQVEIDAEEVLNGLADKGSVPTWATNFLRQALADGPMPSADLRALAEEHGISWNTIQRARHKLAIEVHPSGQRGVWVWEMVKLDPGLFDPQAVPRTPVPL
jgi:AAA domain-containing protein